MPTRRSCSGEKLCLLAHQDSTVRLPENFREKVEPLSLKSLPSLSFLFSLYFSLSFPPLQRLGQVGQVGEYSSCHMSTYYWLIWIISHPLSIIVDFHPLRICHMSTWASFGSPSLTNSAHDTWHLLSHSNCTKCPPNYPRCLEKHEIPTVSEFD